VTALLDVIAAQFIRKNAADCEDFAAVRQCLDL
jgi:hypothetical protein